MWQRSESAPDEAKYSIMANLLQFATRIFVHTCVDYDHLTISYWNPEHNTEYGLADQEGSIV
jgi:G:T-mismatch repair DNA endonuclease (very short patch repair protein)